MAFLDHNDIVIGSTDDGHTFVLLNRALPAAQRILTDHGFTAHQPNRPGRPLFLLPPAYAGEQAHTRTGQAMHFLFRHTMDVTDLSWTTRWNPDEPLPEPDVHFHVSGERVTATARTDAARLILANHGFTPTQTGYALPAGMEESRQLGAVVQAEIALSMENLGARIGLGFRTPDDIPAAPAHTSSHTATPPAAPAPDRPRRTR
ncbi:hypothetical protein DMH15_37230 [Streptomyces sp. WAC 06725]|uniref:hypothetical protein n=1 Tax=Streptomyces sp. WAC 06725 TaxID=2203209 RepID=UPI000F742E2D|nr:hypothetical protein [Streptomyces sp. WAC 06725]RSO18003.1 hypothetical protein DMH15_37230 [Streptomyces sp. WAC 06725]